jgi:hypothetical protein
VERVVAVAWRADWLNAWLAAIGVTRRLPQVKLSWTDDVNPAAVFTTPTVELLEDALPTDADVVEIVIAREHADSATTFPRNPTLEEFAARAEVARKTGDWSLGSTVSDILLPKEKRLPHSPFDPPVPAGVTLHSRMKSALGATSRDQVAESMAGSLAPVAVNGLGFDLRRLAASCVRGQAVVIDPIVEVCAFFGLQLFHQSEGRTRGWKQGSMFSPGAFSWPTWSQPLDWAAIDSVLDEFYSGNELAILGQVFESIAYKKTAAADKTRGYGSRPRR